MVFSFANMSFWSIWGEDFRSDYITGADRRAVTADDLEFIQAYIEAANLFGQPLRIRIGRQLITLGKGWLVGETAIATRAQPFDAVRLTFEAEDYEADVFWSKLAERSPVEESIYSSSNSKPGICPGREPVAIIIFFPFTILPSVRETSFFETSAASPLIKETSFFFSRYSTPFESIVTAFLDFLAPPQIRPCKI